MCWSPLMATACAPWSRCWTTCPRARSSSSTFPQVCRCCTSWTRRSSPPAADTLAIRMPSRPLPKPCGARPRNAEPGPLVETVGGTSRGFTLAETAAESRQFRKGIQRYRGPERDVFHQAEQRYFENAQSPRRQGCNACAHTLVQPVQCTLQSGMSLDEIRTVGRQAIHYCPHDDLHLRGHAMPDQFLRIAGEDIRHLLGPDD